MRRYIAILLAASFLLGSFAACSSQPEETISSSSATSQAQSSQEQVSIEESSPSSTAEEPPSYTMIGQEEGDVSEGGSVRTVPEQERYPVGTTKISLVVTNQSTGDLLYTNWFDFRQIKGDEVLLLTPREGAMTHPDDPNASASLAPGETVTIEIPIDIFPEPLEAGTYRVSQLACFTDPQGNGLACSEITADFILE